MNGLLARMRVRRMQGGAARPPGTRPVTEDEVVAAAVGLATARDLHAVTVDGVASRIGVPAEAVIRHGASDDGLRAVVFHRLVEGELAEVKRLVLAHTGVTEQLRTIAEVLADPVQPENTAAWIEGWSLGRHDTRLAAVEMEAWEVFVASVIRRAVREGLVPQVDADFVAAQLVAMADSANAYSLVGYGTGVYRARLVDSVIERELGLTLHPVPGDSFT